MLNLYQNAKNNQASQVILKTLMKIFKLSKYSTLYSANQKLELNEHLLKTALSLKDIFAVINKNHPFISFSQALKSFSNLESIFPIAKDRLSQKITKQETSQFFSQDYKKAEEYFELAKRENSSNLTGEAFISAQIARYLLANSLQD